MMGRPGATIKVTFNGTVENPEGKVVLNEIMYNPVLAGGDYFELYNNSTTTSFDLSGWRLDGADYDFSSGTVIAPGSYLVVAKNLPNFMNLYGNSIPVAGVFNGELRSTGETLELLRPNNVTTNLLVVDKVTYSGAAPWPVIPAAAGASLQLVDPTLDNSRPANWNAVLTAVSNPPSVKVISVTDNWKYYQNGDPGAQWSTETFNDSAWPSGSGR